MPEVISMTPKDLLIPNTTSIFQNCVPQSNNTPVSGQFRNYKYDSLSKTKNNEKQKLHNIFDLRHLK